MNRLSCAPVIAALFCLVLIFVSCSHESELFLGPASGRRADFEELFGLLEKYRAPEKSKERFIINKQVVDLYNSFEADGKKILFLTTMVGRFPNDPFNGYYLALVAQAYQRMGAGQFAAHYYEKALTSCEDLFFAGEYVHKFCLQELSALRSRPEEKIFYYRELLRRFSQAIDTAAVRFSLARALEETGEYAAAVDAYREFLKLPEPIVPGVPGAATLVREKLYLYENKPVWIRQDLNDLVSRIRTAIETKNVAALQTWRAGAYFFTLTWEQKNDPSLNIFTQASIKDYIGSFLLNSNVVVDAKLDIDSSAREAYLRTDNWAFRVHTTWYFYFRKVDFRPDPEVNGGWEWAGIYFGEKL
jgi:tetratricopeptide (TPR) repeat protein